MNLPIITILSLLSMSAAAAQPTPPVPRVDAEKAITTDPPSRRAWREVRATHASDLWRVDVDQLRAELAAAGHERDQVVGGRATPPARISLPMPDGTWAVAKVWESPVMEEGLAAKWPGIRTYAGFLESIPGATVRLGITPLGFHAIVNSPSGWFVLDRVPGKDRELHQYVDTSRRARGGAAGVCGTVTPPEQRNGLGLRGPVALPNVIGTTVNVRIFRLALGCPAELAAQWGIEQQVEPAVAAPSRLVFLVDQLNEVYRRELGVGFILVANNSAIVFTDDGADPYPNDGFAASSTWLSANQTIIDERIGPDNYDVGHVVALRTAPNTNIAGQGSLTAVCDSMLKARGASSRRPWPGDDSELLEVLLHELGHQFDGRHTYHSTSGACSCAGFGEPYEPGSGSTIMSYGGNCAPDNVVAVTRSQLHITSLARMRAFVNSISCGTDLVFPAEPFVLDSGPDVTIPRLTPYVLRPFEPDPDTYEEGLRTFSWEQIDRGCEDCDSISQGCTTDIATGPMRTTGPLHASLRPNLRPERVFVPTPPPPGEYGDPFPLVSRQLSYACTVRSIGAFAGSVAADTRTVTVDENSGPFRITEPNASTVWTAGEEMVIQWDVAGTDQPPVDCQSADILISFDGGQNFEHLYNVANEGAFGDYAPCSASSQAVIRIMGSGNIFYAQSEPFQIVPRLEQHTVGYRINLARRFSGGSSQVFADQASNVPSGPLARRIDQLAPNGMLGEVRAESGILRARAVARYTGVEPLNAFEHESYAYAEFEDTFIIPDPNPTDQILGGVKTFSFHFSVSELLSIPPPPIFRIEDCPDNPPFTSQAVLREDADVDAYFQYDVRALDTCGIGDVSRFETTGGFARERGWLVVCETDNMPEDEWDSVSTMPFASQAGSGSITVSRSLPFLYDAPISIRATLTAFAQVASIRGSGQHRPMLVHTNAMNSLGWGGISSIIDDAGNPVTEFTVVSASGADYSRPITGTYCAADINNSGSVTTQDLWDFLAFYFAGDAPGDFNYSGDNTVQDLFDFLAAYFTGCA